jgi:hypothetical protein
MTRPKCSTLGLNAVRVGLDKYRKIKLLEEIQED